MLRGLAGRIAATILLICVCSGGVFAGAGGTGNPGSSGTPGPGSTPTPATTTTTSTTTNNVDRGTINNTVYSGTVTVSGALNATLRYVWGQLNVSSAILNQLQAQLGGTTASALNFYRNAVGTLPSNYELLAATGSSPNNFLYYEGSANGFQLSSDITDGANALGVELDAIGGRTYQWSETISGPSNYSYAVQATESHSTTSTQVVKAGDIVLATNTNVATEITNYSGNVNTSVYQVDAHKVVSPIVLDLKGNGRLQASGGNWLPHPGRMSKERLVAFDFNANGFEELMEWVGPDDGLLVEPKADGSVDGSCMFGTTGGWTDGYEKLSMRDANHDGRLNGDELKGLSVWTDRNGNGRVDSGEVRGVSDWKITEMTLMHSNYTSTFVMNGSSHVMWDWWPSALHVRKVRVADVRLPH